MQKVEQEIVRPYALERLAVRCLTLLLEPTFWAIGLNVHQRKAIKDRDDNQCQSQERRIHCGGRLEIDHIIPKSFAEEALKLRPQEYNDPSNLLTKCVNHHRGHPHSHHPDMHQASYEYAKGDKEAYHKASQQHHEASQKGQICWNNENDGLDRQVAADRNKLHDERKGGRRKWWFW